MIKLLQYIDDLHQKISLQWPLDDYTYQRIKEYYRIELTYTSNALEGNSLTLIETKIVLEEGITIGGKRLIDHLEAMGHSDAYTFLYTLAQNKSIDAATILELHKLFYIKIDAANAGVYRSVKAYITGSRYPLPAPDEIPSLMNAFIIKLAALRLEKHPVEVAAWAHKEFVFIHPFIDGNGRVARLLMNLILLQEGYTIAIIPPIVRSDYISCLEKAHTDDHDFMYFIARMVIETEQDYLRLFA